MKITLSIPHPCDEPWDDMLPVSGGRHCDSCAKTVVDLSHCSDAELLRFFADRSSAGSCCRLRDDQMNRTLQLPPEQGACVKVWRRVATLLFAAEMLSGDSYAQSPRPVHPTYKVQSKNKPAKPAVLRGRVTGLDTGWSYGSLTFRIDNSPAMQISPDSGGTFKLPLPAGFRNGTVHWELKDAGEGIILGDSVDVDATLRASGLELEWLKPQVLPKAVLRTKARPASFGGLVVPEREDIAPKRSFFQRMFGIKTKHAK